MAITKLNNYSIGDSDLEEMIKTLDKVYKGKAEITLSEYDTTAAPVVKVGSVFENNGTYFLIDTSDITPTGYSGISNSTTFYLVYDESAGAFIYSSSAPTWNDALQGWYVGNDRYFFSMYKDSGGTLYKDKKALINDRSTKVQLTNGLHSITSENYYEVSGNANTIYDAISYLVPVVGSSIKITGSVSYTISSTNYRIYGVNRLTRTTSSAIAVRGAELFSLGATGGTSLGSVTFTDGVTSQSYNISISW